MSKRNARGIGVDIVEARRFSVMRGKSRERFLSRAFTKHERAYCEKRTNPALYFAGTFAAKEAVFKALGIASIIEFEIRHCTDGTPEVWRKGRRIRSVLLSISHAGAYAVAVALAI